MATIDITGTILRSNGSGVAGVIVSLSPESEDPNSAQVANGIGILDDPVVVQTDVAGDFVVVAESGFRYRLEIEQIGFSRTFRAPTTSPISFHLLGLVPFIEAVVDWTTDDCEGVVITDPVPLTERVKITIKADPISTVLERFDRLIIENGPAVAGPWSAIPESPVLLEPGVIFYDVIRDGPNTDFYRARYSDGTDESLNSDAKSADADDEELVISVDELKELYLFGVDLTDDDGNPYPRRMFQHYIQAAVAQLQKELDIPITPIEVVDEVYDHYADDYGRWGWFQLRNYPIICVRKVAFKYPTQDEEVVIDPEWIVFTDSGQSGQNQIVPGQGNIADVLLIPGHLMPLWSGATARVPGVWRFSYRAGFEVGTVPADIKHAIGMMASIGVFNIAGDLIAGAGIANTSIGIPGLNQSIGTTSSATNSGYGARIGEYQKELKNLIPLLRRYYGKGNRMVVA